MNTHKARLSKGETFVVGGEGLGISVRRKPGQVSWTVFPVWEARAWADKEAVVCSDNQRWESELEAVAYIEGWADNKVSVGSSWEHEVGVYMQKLSVALGKGA